jgi:hypothetical protein
VRELALALPEATEVVVEAWPVRAPKRLVEAACERQSYSYCAGVVAPGGTSSE